ncbi:putative inositol monophosphatase 3 [Hypsibius exemplaris]|uniref:inositol-phosphate phosphatase n=1 Tax=Hypsibius exemplaris TaxID=2072580 RepID=A0A1W0XDS6_HYPEX|nr:putative inositol monophosphatase 3 [Hypsibius exemplaris]
MAQAAKTTIGKLLYYSIKAAELGGKQVKYVVDSLNLDTTFKDINVDPVTVGDIRAHQAMVGVFGKFLPNIKVISEEDDSEKKIEPVDPAEWESVPLVSGEFLKLVDLDGGVNEDDVTVWIDPLDATKEYTEQLYEYVQVMVGIAVKGKAVAGVLHRPFLEPPVTYWAWKDHAVCPELKPFKIQRPANDVLKIVISRTVSHAGSVQQFADTAFGSKNFELVPRGGAGYKILQVILGHADAYLHITKIKKWDLCAGDGIVRALGGNVTSLAGEEIDYGQPAGGVKPDAMVNNGFIIAVYDHDWFLEGCKKAVREVTAGRS